MEDAYLRLAKIIKQGNKAAKNGLGLYYATIQQEVPMVCNTAGGEIVFSEGDNLLLTDDVAEKMRRDSTRRAYIGRTIAVIGVQEFMTIGILDKGGS